jgi:putative membrane protein
MSKKPTVAKQSKKLADSAQKLQRSSARIERSADRRTQLAGDRTIYAAERTYAAWVRTGLFALASGAGARSVLKDFIPEWIIVTNASVLVLFSVFCFAIAVWREVTFGQQRPQPDAFRIPSWMLILVNAVLALVSFAVLFGIWRSAVH